MEVCILLAIFIFIAIVVTVNLTTEDPKTGCLLDHSLLRVLACGRLSSFTFSYSLSLA